MRTMAQTAIAMIGTAAVMNSVDWNLVISASVLSGILSLLTSIAGLLELK
ncbi:MAG: holin [Lachnospiraceae bacterium]|nr:holin [Lachnospiraceae bacterium]MDE7201372.1 holin [Lachnospiraceae bacterium]